MQSLLNLEKKQRKSYPRHFLKSVHCEFGLQGLNADIIMLQEETLKKKYKALGFLDVKKIFHGKFLMSEEDGPKIVGKNSGVIGLSFSNQNIPKNIHLLGDRITINDFSYKGFENFKTNLKNYCDILFSVTNDCKITKVGLRKNTI